MEGKRRQYAKKNKVYKKKYLRRYKQPSNVLQGFIRRKIEYRDQISMIQGESTYRFYSANAAYVDNKYAFINSYEYIAQAKVNKFFKITGVSVRFTPYANTYTEVFPCFIVANRPDHEGSALNFFNNGGDDTALTCQVGTGAPVSKKYWVHDNRMGVIFNGIATNGLIETDPSLLANFLGGSIQINNIPTQAAGGSRILGEIRIIYYCNFYMNTGASN